MPEALPRHRSCVTVSGASVCACGHKLSLTATFSLSPPPLLRRGVGTLHSAVNPMPTLAIPSRRCRAAALLPPFRTDAILTATFLPPAEEEAAYIPSPGTFLLFVCDAMPAPGRCAVRRCTDSTPAVGQPLHSLRVCLRLRARAGRLTVCGASSSTESLSLRASATPAVCANPFVGTPSSLRSFG